MTLPEAFIFWVSTFSTIFLLSFQSRNVNSGRMFSAGATSFLLAAAQLFSVRGIVTGDPLSVLLITGTSGPIGVMSSMLFYRRVYADREER